MSHLPTLLDMDLDHKTVLVRVDFNVPFKTGTIEISDDSRIRAAVETIRYLVESGSKIILCTHIGRPKGQVVEDLRTKPMADRLSRLLGRPVYTAPDCVGPGVAKAVSKMSSGDILMLENLRFHSAEEANNSAFAFELSSLAEVYVNDAFGAAHRAHASTVGLPMLLPSAAGFLLQREIEFLGSTLDSPKRPLLAIIGGAKISDKIKVLEHLVPKVNNLLIGGGMAASFLKATGINVGSSMVEEDMIESANKIFRLASDLKVDLLLPTDVVISNKFIESASHKIVSVTQIPDGWMIMDIGPETSKVYAKATEDAGTIIWNGPMGVCEWKAFAHGTNYLCKTLSTLRDATTVIGGGSTASAVGALELSDAMTHVSTGGGASLEFLEGKILPGVAALMR